MKIKSNGFSFRRGKREKLEEGDLIELLVVVIGRPQALLVMFILVIIKLLG